MPPHYEVTITVLGAEQRPLIRPLFGGNPRYATRAEAEAEISRYFLAFHPAKSKAFKDEIRRRIHIEERT